MAGIPRTGADILRLRFGIERAVTRQIGPRRIRCLELLDREVASIAEEAVAPVVLQMERDPVLPLVLPVVPRRGLTEEPLDGLDRAEQMGPAGCRSRANQGWSALNTSAGSGSTRTRGS